MSQLSFGDAEYNGKCKRTRREEFLAEMEQIITYASGKVEMWEPKVGEHAWMDGEEAHTAENVGKTTLQYLMVEVKGVPAKTPN